MSGNSNQHSDTTQQQQSTTAPWQPTQQSLQNILNGVTNAGDGTNANTTAALQSIMQNAQATPNYTPQSNAYAANMLGGGGGPTNGNAALTAYQQSQQPFTAASYLDPTQSPGMQAALQAITAQTNNSVNSQFAGAGRDMSPANSTAAGYGIAQAEAPLLLGQYNQNVATQQAANQNLYGAANTTTGLNSALNQTALGNQATGFNYITGQQPGVNNAGANNVINASQAAYNLPLNNLGTLEGLTVPIAGLGSQNSASGTSSTDSQQSASPLQQAMGYASIFSSIFGGAGSGGAANGAKNFLFGA